MSAWEKDLVDPFLADVEDEQVAALLEALAGAAVSPPRSLRDRIMASADLDGRFDRFLDSVAELLDVDSSRARSLLDGIGRSESWYQGLVPDVKLYDIEGGPSVSNAITGFVRLPEGVSFPEHGHLGLETSYILQGSAEDNHGAIWRPGDVVVRASDHVHSFRARPGPDFLFLVVAQQGIQIGDLVIGPDDPRM